MTGTIKRLTDKNFGFIALEEGGNDLFFHANNLVDVDFDALREGDKVEFEIVDTPKGQAAEKVKKI
ncbi:MAG: cold shock domain-containing protein [Patescibacteria group bacterium]|nr:cold shock domain-containing protein [Patescibacteria group bacterium]